MLLIRLCVWRLTPIPGHESQRNQRLVDRWSSDNDINKQKPFSFCFERCLSVAIWAKPNEGPTHPPQGIFGPAWTAWNWICCTSSTYSSYFYIFRARACANDDLVPFLVTTAGERGRLFVLRVVSGQIVAFQCPSLLLTLTHGTMSNTTVCQQLVVIISVVGLQQSI